MSIGYLSQKKNSELAGLVLAYDGSAFTTLGHKWPVDAGSSEGSSKSVCVYVYFSFIKVCNFHL